MHGETVKNRVRAFLKDPLIKRALRHCATSWKIISSISKGVNGITV
jgi:hypothetical protein